MWENVLSNNSSFILYFFFIFSMNLWKAIDALITNVWFRLIAGVALALLIFVVGYEAYHAYMLNHTYYFSMLESGKNWWIIFWMIVCGLIPVATIVWKWRLSLKHISIAALIAIVLSGIIHSSYKGGSVGGGWMVQIFYTLLLIAFIGLMLLATYTLGAWLYERFLRKKVSTRYDVLFVTGIGLCVFLLLNYILVLVHLFYPLLAWLQVAAVGFLIYKRRDLCQKAVPLIESMGAIFQKESVWKRVFLILLLISFVYLLIWFHLSFIPYSTAWDANHAYMYIPKVWAENHGFFRQDGPSSSPFLWMIYISYRFSLMQPLSKVIGLAPDTVAVVLNFISGPLALIFWLGALRKVVNYFLPSLIWQNDNTSVSHLPFALGWMYFLLWLMSGMGAFLVFVDNKTDLGVMALSMLALMGGFLFLSKTGDTHTLHNASHEKETTFYAILSGIFFSAAIMAKPTAFQDVLIFGLLIVALRWSWLGATGLFFVVLGAFAKLKILGIVFFLTPAAGTSLIIIGLLLTILAVIITFIRSWRSEKNLWWWIKPLAIWWASLILMLLIVKLPYLIPMNIINKTLTPSTVMKGLIMGYVNSEQWDSKTVKYWNKPLLLAATNEVTQTLLAQAQAEEWQGSSVSSSSPSLSPQMCSLAAIGETSSSLMEDLPEVIGGGIVEDLWRYIGFWQRVFTDPSTWTTKERREYGFVRLGYPLLRLLYAAPAAADESKCYGSDELAMALCEDPALIRTVNPSSLEDLQQKTSSGSLGNEVIAQLMRRHEAIKNTSTYQTDLPVFITDMQKSLTDYMQSRVVQVSKDNDGNVSIAIPYGQLTPLNVIFNRSLQNLSSYYTDIGFVWIISILLLLVGIISTAVYRRYQLFVLHLVTLFGWIIRWLIASGIIWYAVGLIAWTLFTNVLYISSLFSNADKSKNTLQNRVVGVILFLLIALGVTQTILNLIRIASQGGEWPFTRYKGSTGRQQSFTISTQGVLPREEIVSFGYDDVFNLQFGHYNSFINAVANRKDEEGILIAGTYLQYFLPNQHNLFSDGLLTTLWQRGADGNTCSLALRLQQKKIKYLVIDPNIGSVVMGGGNASLFDRFLAKIDPVSQTIITDGTMTMLSKMIDDGYLTLLYTNNLAAKYVYSLSDEEILQTIQSLPDANARTRLETQFQSDPLLLRAKIAVLRFFPQEANDYMFLVGTLFQKRLANPQTGIADLADALGKQVRVAELAQIIMAMQNDAQGSFAQNAPQIDKALSNDEKTILAYYFNLIQWFQSGNPQQAQQMVSNILQQSIGGGSQLVTFKTTL